ncbi:AMP-dependent synthetase/ligase [Penicillium citrinum]|uniref:AMP-dependent synthetase/ligase n=1 Tax=Penicillium citrinum TaxID=5077 RepID=A0A9W9NQA4_PENCI|nr:AMP-dependent synthetase/ligase [Penicillium citrinum]KAJ5224167.1 AMP-dependent synthetase/ligase [Penicillium citrinum]
MIFEPAERVLLPTKDLLSYIFDDPPYDQDKPIYIDTHNPSRTISCNEARKLIRRLIAGLRASGLRKGDCVLIHSFNDINYSILVLAIIGAGGIFTGSNPAYTSHELAHHIKSSESKFLITEPEILDPLTFAAAEVGIPDHHVWIFDNLGQPIPTKRQSWKELLSFGEEDWVRFDDLQTAKSTTAARLFSSGTTGLPKAVTITHHNLIAQHELVLGLFTTIALDHQENYTLSDTGLQISRIIAVPVFHASAAPVTHISTLKAGNVAYMMRRFDLEGYLSTVERFDVTDLAMRPFLRKVRLAACGAAPLDKDVQARFRSLMGDDSPFTQVWGMTETSCIATMFPFPEHDDTGSVGRLIPNLEAKLIDESGQNISAYNVRGELCVRGPTVTPGYYKNQEANAQSFDNEGWFKTGDIAYCDRETRKWYIVDRRKELIKVIDAAVIGITIPGATTEFPRAYVVRRQTTDGEKVTEEELRKYVLDRLARYKELTGGVKFVGSIARNPSGKILKRVLREDAKKEVESGAIKPRL